MYVRAYDDCHGAIITHTVGDGKRGEEGAIERASERAIIGCRGPDMCADLGRKWAQKRTTRI